MKKSSDQMLTGFPDADREIVMKLDDRELLIVCGSPNKYSIKLCNEDFFRNRSMKYLKDFIQYKEPSMSWKKFYILIVSNIDRNDFEIFVTYKNKPMFIDRQNYFLSIYLRHLHYGGDIEQELHFVLILPVMGNSAIIDYNMSTMESVLKIMMILKTLKVKDVPENFMDYFAPIESLDAGRLLYVNYEPFKPYVKQMEEEIDNIYKRVMKDTE